MSTTTEIKYGLRHKPTGQLVRINSAYGETNYGAYHGLTLDDFYPVFALETPAELIPVMSENPSCYNADAQRPVWGGLDMADMEPVEVVTETTITPVHVKTVKNFRCVNSLNISKREFKLFTGKEPPKARYYNLRLVLMPDDMTRDEINDLVGEQVMFGSYHTRDVVYGVVDVTPEYADQFKGKEGLMLVSIAAN